MFLHSQNIIKNVLKQHWHSLCVIQSKLVEHIETLAFSAES